MSIPPNSRRALQPFCRNSRTCRDFPCRHDASRVRRTRPKNARRAVDACRGSSQELGFPASADSKRTPGRTGGSSLESGREPTSDRRFAMQARSAHRGWQSGDGGRAAARRRKCSLVRVVGAAFADRAWSDLGTSDSRVREKQIRRSGEWTATWVLCGRLLRLWSRRCESETNGASVWGAQGSRDVRAEDSVGILSGEQRDAPREVGSAQGLDSSRSVFGIGCVTHEAG